MGNAIESHTESQSDDEMEDDTPRDWESTVKSDPCFATERQEQLREELGLAAPEMAALIRQSEFISLGSHCGVAMTLENMGLRKSAYPFDWVRLPADGALRCLETDFKDFLTYTRIQPGIHNQKFFFGSSWGGSFWHHDLEDLGVRDTFCRRIERFLGADGHLEGLTARIFVRVANSPEELALAPKLLAALQRKMGQVRVFLLVIIDMQKQVGLVHVDSVSSNLLFYRVHEDLWLQGSNRDFLEQRHRSADTYAVAIAAALQYWVQEEVAPVEETSGIAAVLQYWTQQKQEPVQAAVLRDIATLNAYTERFDGGDCNGELYKPQRHKEPIYVRLPQAAVLGRS